jgi:hypothetical protein
VWLLASGVGIGSQAYRFRHVSGPMERQQMKWVAVGFAAVTLGIILNATLLYTASEAAGLTRLLYHLSRTPLTVLCLLGMPVSLAFSILRYRLWDIDLIIRRTLIYTSLTATLALVFLSCVVFLQTLVGGLAGERQPELVTVLSTLAIATLFFPLRRRVQNIIDRRFFRQKYDAARMLAGFAAATRDEVDLDSLSAQLVDAVDDAMQPERVSLWLRPNPRAAVSGPPVYGSRKP